MKVKIPSDEIDELMNKEDVEDLVQKNMDRAITNSISVANVNICNTNSSVFSNIKEILMLLAPLKLDNPTQVAAIEANLVTISQRLSVLSEHFEKEKALLEAKYETKH